MPASVASQAPARRAAPAAGVRATALADPPLLIAAALSLRAALVHLQTLPEHWRDWWGYGVFFLLTGIGQGLYAPALVRWPRAGVVALGIAGNLVIVATYVWSRTVGVPWGPHAGRPESVAVGDFLTTAGEVVLVLMLVGHLGPRAHRWTLHAMMLLGVGAGALRFTDVL